jgi:hypothetical protein
LIFSNTKLIIAIFKTHKCLVNLKLKLKLKTKMKL